ncbi:hypothetical protein I6F35_16555 [Bradyrhizobium sp. BRP22]|uniref:hypothetical protein n=1 Tax=Bradyrhizobium sp. BRP22 TaxID=2793821 RepID=UPI001CD5CD32|nr:hypothetical protein [Bradyrhizobium sp. BRP22]MCA1454821.1 hypothetical protein [Bradyrhizobium sp. BRP22]
MRIFDFLPLWRSTVGFDRFAVLLDASLRQSADDGRSLATLNRPQSAQAIEHNQAA